MKQIGIYGFQSRGSGKWYVGQSRDMVHRHQDHWRLLCKGIHPNELFQRAFTQGGENNIEYVVLSFLLIKLVKGELKEWLNTTEKLWIKTLNAKVSGYNQTIGGAGTVGWRPDPLVKNLYPWGRKIKKKRLVGKAYWRSFKRSMGLGLSKAGLGV